MLSEYDRPTLDVTDESGAYTCTECGVEEVAEKYSTCRHCVEFQAY